MKMGGKKFTRRERESPEKTKDDGWKKIEVVIDSGAGTNVQPSSDTKGLQKIAEEEYKFKGDEYDFEAGESNSSHFISEEKAISLYDCCRNGIECSYFDQYIEDECTWATKDDEKNIIEMIERFMVFCKESQGFLII